MPAAFERGRDLLYRSSARARRLSSVGTIGGVDYAVGVSQDLRGRVELGILDPLSLAGMTKAIREGQVAELRRFRGRCDRGYDRRFAISCL